MRATAPAGSAEFENSVAWSGELGYGVRAPEQGQAFEDLAPASADDGHGHDDHGHDDHGHDDGHGDH